MDIDERTYAAEQNKQLTRIADYLQIYTAITACQLQSSIIANAFNVTDNSALDGALKSIVELSKGLDKVY